MDTVHETKITDKQVFGIAGGVLFGMLLVLTGLLEVRGQFAWSVVFAAMTVVVGTMSIAIQIETKERLHDDRHE